jgi:hypothetical protein
MGSLLASNRTEPWEGALSPDSPSPIELTYFLNTLYSFMVVA